MLLCYTSIYQSEMFGRTLNKRLLERSRGWKAIPSTAPSIIMGTKIALGKTWDEDSLGLADVRVYVDTYNNVYVCG